MPNGLRIDIISKAQSWLVLNLPVFMFVCIHFNVPLTRITDLVRNVSDEKVYWYGTFTLSAGMFLLLSSWFLFNQLYSKWILYLSLLYYYYKRLFHFFFKSDYCPRLWNRNFLCVICKARSINFESPLFRVPCLPTFSWSMDYLNTIYIE